MAVHPSEAASLAWPDVDAAAGHLRVGRVLEHHLVGRREDGRWAWKTGFEELKNPGARRKVTLPEALLALPLEHRQAQARQLGALGATNAQRLVYSDSEGKAVDLNNVRYRHFGPILKRAGLPRVRLYDLRHAHATALLLAGLNPKVVAERLGRRTVTTTLDVYSHVLPGLQQEAAEVIGRLLREPPRRPN